MTAEELYCIVCGKHLVAAEVKDTVLVGYYPVVFCEKCADTSEARLVRQSVDGLKRLETEI